MINFLLLSIFAFSQNQGDDPLNKQIKEPASNSQVTLEVELANQKKAYQGYLREFYQAKDKTSFSVSKFNDIWNFSENGVFFFREWFYREYLRSVVGLAFAQKNNSQVWLKRYLKTFERPDQSIFFEEDLSFFLELYTVDCGSDHKDEAFLSNWLLLERYLATQVEGGYPWENAYLKKKKSLLSPELEEELAFLRELEPFQSKSLPMFKDLYKQASEGVSFCDLKVLDPRKPSE